MKGSKSIISSALSTLRENLLRTGDPLGFKRNYWTGWAQGLGLPRQGRTLLFTARMYQMLPYVIQTTDLMETARPLMAVKGLNRILVLGGRLAGEQIIRQKAKGETKIRQKGENILRGITAALKAVGQNPGYLYESEPYSGVLLYDLGLEDEISDHIHGVYRLFKHHNIREVITVDPHTTFMLREIYPRYINGFDIHIRHYLEVLQERADRLIKTSLPHLPEALVLHDSCVMTRDLGYLEEARKIVQHLGIRIVEPENKGLDTACCGGPVEYAFSDISSQVSAIRMGELSPMGKDILVTCPICLVNLEKHERVWGVRVWDMGEVLHEVLSCA